MIQEEIRRLRALGNSQRKCAIILGVSRNTIRKYWEASPAIEDEDYPPWAKGLDWEDIKKEVETGVPRKILYKELLLTHEDLPGYSSFTRFYKTYIADKGPQNITMKIVREPGYSVEVDYSGDGFEILNPSTGEVQSVELFVGALSFSSDFYAEFTFTQKQEDFIKAQENMFQYFGGVPKYIVPDNCKTAIIFNDSYDPEINRAYHDFCTHYNVTVDPARVRRPQDKPIVERTVGVIQQNFLASIRNKTYTSLYQLNQDLRAFIDEYRHQVMSHRGKSRYEFYLEEKEKLSPLPESLFELFNYKKVKVHPDCHFQLNKCFYSVPYRYVGKQLEIKFNQSMIYAYFEGDVIATHKFLKGHTHYSTQEEHYPSAKIVEINYHLNHAKAKAKRIGEDVLLVIEKLIKENRHPLKNLRKIQGILSLSDKYSPEALNYGCDRALEFNKLVKRFIENCAKSYRPKKDNNKSKTPIRQLDLICLQGGKK